MSARRELEGWARLRMQKLEAGIYPSGIIDGVRVELATSPRMSVTSAARRQLVKPIPAR